MSGYSTYTRWQRIELQARSMGFRIGNPKHGWGREDGDALPVFGRDTDIFTGTFSQVEIFLAGWARAQQYDSILRLSDDKKRKKYEDRERARQAEQRKREEQKKMLAVLRATDAQNQGKKK